MNHDIRLNVSKRIAANLARANQVASENDLRYPPVSLIDNASAMDHRRIAATRLQELWASLIPEGTPDLTTFYDWFDRFRSALAERGIRRTADKAKMKRRTSGEQPFTAEGAARYASATMRGMAESEKPVVTL